MELKHISKQHNKTLLLYHLVCPVKYRRKVFTKDVEQTLKNICNHIEHCYEIIFIEIGVDNDHVHFLFQTVPTYSPTKCANTIKGITAKQIFLHHPTIKKEILWGGHFWTAGYYINTVGQFSNLEMMKIYIKNQGTKEHQKQYEKIYTNPHQQALF